MNDVKHAMKIAIREAVKVKGVIKISAGNFGGTLGKYKIELNDLYNDIVRNK
jgi:formylmethanofuran--tetrahydromethanopterin N-formyltransferase